MKKMKQSQTQPKMPSNAATTYLFTFHVSLVILPQSSAHFISWILFCFVLLFFLFKK